MRIRAIRKLNEIREGCVDYLVKKKDKNTYGGPFNKQKIRQEIFGELLKNFRFEEIIETGTFLGNTTEYLYKTSRVIVRTIEIDPRKFGFAMARFFKYPKIKTYLGKSDVRLRELCKQPNIQRKLVFFYLDAHRNGKLPLMDEIETIFANIKQAVVMIDDFKVPDFPGYGFDKYPSGESLDLEYLSPLKHLDLQFFFPAADPKTETGKKRGCVVLTTNEDFAGKLQSFSTLKAYGNY
jgi:hypothetical protein